jgi:hypothetical protein
MNKKIIGCTIKHASKSSIGDMKFFIVAAVKLIHEIVLWLPKVPGVIAARIRQNRERHREERKKRGRFFTSQRKLDIFAFCLFIGVLWVSLVAGRVIAVYLGFPRDGRLTGVLWIMFIFWNFYWIFRFIRSYEVCEKEWENRNA